MSGSDQQFGYDDGLIDTNMSANPTLNEIVADRYSRRQALFGSASAVAIAMLGGSLVTACGDGDGDTPAANVSAGGAVTTSAGKAVKLTGTANGATRGNFVQTGGPSATVVATDTFSTTIIAPAVSAATPLTFRFDAIASDRYLGGASTTVTVNPADLGFAAVAKNLTDVVTVPDGYSITILYRLGDPIDAATPAYANNGTDTGFANRAGDHHDGMSYFGLAATGNAPDPTNNNRGLLVLNHENINQAYLHPNGPTNVGGARPEAEAIKEIECHGVSVVEIVRASATGAWSYVQASALNRRITPLTPTSFAGPVAGSTGLRTAYSPAGTDGRGTLNNCANGYMPWGTYMTNEENWAGYFRREVGDVAARGGPTAKANVSLARYGIPEGRAGNFGWATVTPANGSDTSFRRWNVTQQAGAAADGTADFRNEANQFGWSVEIDPFNKSAIPRKRTALGRMNHEGCWPGRTVAGVKPAFYMGDDAANEYIYKFISANPWAAADAAPGDRLATGDKYLNNGTLYVAKFNADGTGLWMPLIFGTGPLTAANPTYAFADQADVLMNARLAADALGATKMDRPEWTAVNPVTGEMYCTLTQNTTRTPANTDAANPRAYTDPKTNGAVTNGNANGHIIRIRETGDTTEATSFAWDVYAFGAGSDLSGANVNLSGLDASNDFSMADGLWFARASSVAGQTKPLLWIETDDNAFTDVTNCMLLAAMPGTVNDGATKTITNVIGAASATQTARVGKAPGASLRRFLVGCKECEITGIDTTPDGRSLFVNIQHPGELGNPGNITSNWPASQAGPATGVRPRSATIVITKDDGGVVGL
ncbi:MAG TPA: alkaline phosphatase PhoX [Sphingomonas sp.]|nr:alkaline phosphatase PhoX [Sphingomonas sp.]